MKLIIIIFCIVTLSYLFSHNSNDVCWFNIFLLSIPLEVLNLSVGPSVSLLSKNEFQHVQALIGNLENGESLNS